jgi:hypothetical protein
MDAFLRICEEISLGEDLNPDLRSERLVSAAKVLLEGIGVAEDARFDGLSRGEGCKVYGDLKYLRASVLTIIVS